MPKEVSNKKSEKNVKKNTPKKTLKQKTSNDTKNRRPQVGKLVKRYLQRIYDVTGINPTKMVKTKDGKLKPKNINTIRKLVHRKFSHLDSHGLNKHIAAIFNEQYKTPDVSVFKREFEPFGSNISNDISNLIERFNTNIPFIKPNVIKSERKYNEFGIPLPIEVKYDYDDMRFDKYSGIKNDARRYAVDIVNEVFKGVNGEKPEKMRTNIITSIHNIKLETAPNESREDIENKYKEDVLEIINNIDTDAYMIGIDDPNNAIRNSLNDLKQKLIDRIKDDDFDVDDDPIENYREAVEYGVRRMMSDRLTDELLMEINAINRHIDEDENREYDEDTIYNIYQKLSHFSDNIGLKQIDGIVVDKILRKRYHEIIPKIDEYLTKAYDKYRGKDERMTGNIDLIYEKYLADAIYNARNNTPDKEIELIRDINKSFDDKGGLKYKIVEEAKNTFNELGQTTRGTDRKNIDHNIVANTIANKLDSMKDVNIDTIREVAKDVLYGIKEKADSKISKSLAGKARDIMADNVVSRLFNLDEFRNVIRHQPMKTMLKYVNLEPMDRFEAIPPEERANKLLKEAANKHQDVIENVMMDGKEESESNEEYEHQDEEHQDDEKQLELSESSESSTIEPVNEEEEDLEEEPGDDKNTSNEMSDTSKPLVLKLDVMSESVKPQIPGFADVGTNPTKAQLVIENGDVIDYDQDPQPEYIFEHQPGIYIPQDANPLVPQQQGGELAIQDGNGVTSENLERGDIALLEAGMDQIKHAIAELRYSQSQSETNNIFNGMASVLRELPNGVDDEVANRLSQAVGPNGTKLFESKEEAARFLAMLRNLMGGNLSTLRGSGNSEQKHAIRLNIDNKVVSNMPRKPFIVDTHPIPYQY